MRVLFDGVIYRIQKYGGVVRYFNSLISHLPKSTHPILLAPNQPAVAPQHPKLDTYIETCGNWLWAIKPIRKRIIAKRTYQRIQKERPDVLHPTYYYSSMRHLTNSVSVPTVLTVYDLIHERFPSEMDPKGRQLRLKKSAIARADAIICISESTKRDLLEFYSYPEDRVHVIHLGSDFQRTIGPTKQPQSERPYFLYVGGRKAYKNFERLLYAFGNFNKTNPDFVLKCVGGPEFNQSETLLVEKLGIRKSLVCDGNLSDQQIHIAYSNALGLIYPSLYEGFGIPIIEAMSCGTPVATSNVSSMPEVAGSAAILFDPGSVDAIEDALRQLTNQSIRNQLIENGLERSKLFSWDRVAAQTHQVYQTVVSRRAAA